jgi:nitroreductase
MTNKPVPSETLLGQLRWRYATKKFDPARRISAGDWSVLEQVMALAPSSYGLQPWKFLVVADPATRQKLLPAAWNQRQIVEASHLVVLTFHTQMSPADVQRLIDRIVEVRGVPAASLDGYKQMMLAMVNGMSAAERDAWAARQAYLALGMLLTAAAMLGIDACPMEGFEPAKFNDILGLPRQGYSAVALGYRAADDKYAELPKVRFEASRVIQHI